MLIMLCIFLTACGTSASGKDSEKEEINEETKVLKGTVYDGTMNTITVKDENGDIYSFAKESGKVEVSQDGIIIGCPVAVEYTGKLERGADFQDVAVNKITVSEEPTRKTARDMLSGMSLEEKAGQMFLARCPQSGYSEDIAEYCLGGYILFARDFENETEESVSEKIIGFQSESKIPMIIAVDEEGGTVNRVSRFLAFRQEPFKSPQELYSEGGFELIKSDTREKCALLKNLGINLNLAPVCDVSENSEDFIYDRSFGRGAGETSEYVKTVVGVMKSENMGCALKHFPGYGSNKDTHMGIAYDSCDREAFDTGDFLPFKAGIDSGAGIVLVSHNIVECMDNNNPASLSDKVHEVLRHDLGFDGVIMTDDLSMEAIKQSAGDKEAAVAAVLAGNDLLCCTNYQEQFNAVIEAVRSGVVPESRIDESVMRILLWKINNGVID